MNEPISVSTKPAAGQRKQCRSARLAPLACIVRVLKQATKKLAAVREKAEPAREKWGLGLTVPARSGNA